MRPEDIEKLLAGYATGTLDEAERRALMQAALERQELFDALAEEEALRELLADRRCRRQLLELLGVSRSPLWRRALSWLQRPAGIAALASSAAAVVLVSSLVIHMGRGPVREPEPRPPQRAEPAAVTVDAKRAETTTRPSVAQPPPPPAAAHRKPRPAAAPETLPEAPARTGETAQASIAAEQPVSTPAGVRARRAAPSAVQAQAVVERGAVADELLPTAAPVTPLLRFSILQQGTAAAPNAELRTGEPLELRVEAEQSGRVLLFRLEERGAMRLLFPSGEQDSRIQAGAALTIPLAPRTEPGEERLVLVLSPEGAAETPATFRVRQTPRAAAMTPAALPPADPRFRTEIRLRFR